ncbi:MAG: single-stranded DNA-binding protein [Bulleidia sp.]|nr:single-stranded DNA-binding protein [Bulleidia sp.]
MNDCVLIGRVAAKPEIRTTSRGNTVADMVLDVDRNFRNEDGTRDKDTFQITLWKGIAEEIASTVKIGQMVAVKGRLTGNANEKEGRTWYNTNIIAERVDILRN